MDLNQFMTKLCSYYKEEPESQKAKDLHQYVKYKLPYNKLEALYDSIVSTNSFFPNRVKLLPLVESLTDDKRNNNRRCSFHNCDEPMTVTPWVHEPIHTLEELNTINVGYCHKHFYYLVIKEQQIEHQKTLGNDYYYTLVGKLNILQKSEEQNMIEF